MDADAIYKEVERRTQRAEELKIRETVWPLYHDSLKGYPSWLKNCPDYMYPGITDPNRSRSGPGTANNQRKELFVLI